MQSFIQQQKGGLVKYDYIDADGVDHISEVKIDNGTKTNSPNEQKTIKIRTNNHDEWWFCFDYTGGSGPLL